LGDQDVPSSPRSYEADSIPLERMKRMKSHYGLYINGQETEAQTGATFTVENPATGKALTTVADAAGEDVERAVAAARESFADGRWSALRGRDRAQILRKAADALA